MFSNPRRQHPVAVITGVLLALRELLLPLVIVFLFGRRGDPAETAFWLRMLPVVGIIVFALGAGILKWVFFHYWLQGNELRVTRGLLIRKKIFIPRHRIQVIDITSGIIQRSFGLVSLNVQTAGGDTPGITINALKLEEALELRSLLRQSDLQQETATDTDYPTDPSAISDVTLSEPDPIEAGPSEAHAISELSVAATTRTSTKNDTNNDSKQTSWRLSADHLLIGAATSSGFGIFLSLLATLYTQASYMIDEEEMIDWFSNLAIPEGSTVIFLGIMVVVLAWVMSFGSYILGFANFRIRKLDEEMVITKGLLERKQITIPYRRIQSLRIVEGLMRQPFGFVTIRVDSAGFGEKSGQTTDLMPMLPAHQVQEFIKTMLPEYLQDVPTHKAPERSLVRFIMQTTLPVILLVGLASWLLPMGYLAGLALPVALVLGYQRYKDTEAGWNGNFFFLKYRKLARTTCIIPGYRVQATQTDADPIQRFRSLTDLSINVASSNTGARFIVPNLDNNHADLLSNKVNPSSAKYQTII
jgi:putative membrane protein